MAATRSTSCDLGPQGRTKWKVAWVRYGGTVAMSTLRLLLLCAACPRLVRFESIRLLLMDGITLQAGIPKEAQLVSDELGSIS